MAMRRNIFSDDPGTVVMERIELVRLLVRHDVATGREETDELQRNPIGSFRPDKPWINTGTDVSLEAEPRVGDLGIIESEDRPGATYARLLALCRSSITKDGA